MSRRNNRKQPLPSLENIEIIDAGAEGKAIGRSENRVVFISYGVPGDIVDVQVTRKKSSFYEGRITNIHRLSPDRVEPVCSHFGLCGGCRWQNMDYKKQLYYKQKQVKDHFDRIGKFEYPELKPILASEYEFHYRNKLDYTFSNRKWFTEARAVEGQQNVNTNGLGFHLPGMFDRIINIEKCYLQPEPSNAIRLAVNEFCLAKGWTYYDVKTWEGLLRNLIIRNNSRGEFMVIVVFKDDEKEIIQELLSYIRDKFPAVSSLMYVINAKRNDDISDQETILFHGDPFLMEELPALGPDEAPLKFKIGPVSFFQVNVAQASRLYHVAAGFAGLTGEEIVYDLYSGTGTIACYVAGHAKKVIGLEYVEPAVSDAKINAAINGIENVGFHAGDIAKILTNEFISEHGRPDVIITDPPRNGMHEKVVNQIIEAGPEKVVYVSCNPATQARDIQLMSEHYKVTAVQPVDMFPHTQHVENVALLEKR